METYLETYVLAGGPLMFVLIPGSIVLVATVIQAMINLSRARVIPQAVLKLARGVRSKNDRIAFAREIAALSSPLANALRLTFKSIDIRAGNHPHKRQIEPLITESVATTADDMFDIVGRLSTLYTVAPLVGLLGTILGMMQAFSEFGAAQDKDLSLLSEGIQEALVTTLWGLGIATVAYISAQFFQTRIQRFERNDLPDTIHEVIDAVFSTHPEISFDNNPEPPESGRPAAVEPEDREVRSESA